MTDEETPLLATDPELPNNLHEQFCVLIGIPPSNRLDRSKWPTTNTTPLYERAVRMRSSQNLTYSLTASLSNTLLLTQVVLGATLTGLGASASSHILITIFGALNTVIAGLIAYLKSRGQPMRARMFRDDLQRVVDEIENSEIMWLGITENAHGYSDIDTDSQVSVRSEVARLTRLYDRAVKNDTLNNPDNYSMSAVSDALGGLRSRPTVAGQASVPDATPAVPPVPAAAAAASDAPAAPGASTTAAATAADPDESPATSPPKPSGTAQTGPANAASTASATPAPASKAAR